MLLDKTYQDKSNVKDETMGRLQLLQEKELRLAGCSRDCNKRSKAVLQAMSGLRA